MSQSGAYRGLDRSSTHIAVAIAALLMGVAKLCCDTYLRHSLPSPSLLVCSVITSGSHLIFEPFLPLLTSLNRPHILGRATKPSDKHINTNRHIYQGQSAPLEPIKRVDIKMTLSDLHGLCLVTLLTSVVYNGLALHLDMNPKPVNPAINKQLNATCVSNEPANWAKDIVTIEIGKEGSKPIAVLRRGKVEMALGSEANMQAVGHIADDVSHSYLTVTIDNPDITDTGTYSCLMHYLDQEYQIQERKTLLNITVNDKDITVMFNHLLGKINDQGNLLSRLEKSLQEQKDVNSKQEKALQDQRDVNSRQERALEEQRNLNDRQETVLHQQRELLARQTQETYITAFSYGYNEKNPVLQDTTLVFSDEILNIGDRYNPNTGIFTCPWDGLYVFHLLILTHHYGDQITVNLVVNGIVQTSLDAYHRNYDDQSSTSSIVSAKAGDMVKPVVSYFTTRQRTVDPTNHFSVFSGYLLRLL